MLDYSLSSKEIIRHIVNMYYLYLINNNFDLTLYVGYAKNPKKRMREHRNPTKKEQHKHLYRAMASHGKENFFMTVICERETLEEIKQTEIDHIKMYKESGAILYNHSDGGEGSSGYKWTDEQKVKISGENHPQFGKIPSEETKLKISNANTGSKHSEEAKIKISKARDSNKKPVILITEIGDEVEFPSINAAANFTGIDKSKISAVANGNRGSSYSYKFRFK